MWAAGFVVLACGAIVGISGWQEYSSREDRLRSAEVEMGNLARSLVQHAEDSLDLIDSGIVGIVSRLEMDGTNRTTIAKLTNLMDARRTAIDRIHGLAILDEHGNWLASSGALSHQLSSNLFFEHHRLSPDRDAYVSPPVQNLVDGEWIVTLSRRFNHPDGSFAGVVVGSISASYLSEFYRQFAVGQRSGITLLHVDGHVIARNPDNAAYVGRDLSQKPVFKGASLEAASGTYQYVSSVDGLKRLSFFRRSARFPLVVLTTVQKNELLAAWCATAIMRMLIVLALVIMIGVIGGFLVWQLMRSRRLARVLASSEANFRLLAEGSSDMVTRIGLDDIISYASPSSVGVVGWHPKQLVGHSALAGINAADLPAVQETIDRLKRGEIDEGRTTRRTRHRDKGEIWIESTLRVTRNENGEIDGAVAITRDVTEQKVLEEKLEALAIEDGLTGLANRRRFDERLSEEWARAQRERTSLSLLIVDLDHFKAYNDAYGHVAGDSCLRAVARILAEEAERAGDVAARYGGEEFAILMPNTDSAGCTRIGERVRSALRKAAIPHALNPPFNVVTASLGGAACRPGSDRSTCPTSLIEAADRALYVAKDQGRDRLAMSAPVLTLFPAASGA
jgi:diguanylate cyclase (GGDEF)-like protein/PAS domain S-box-containing protein